MFSQADQSGMPGADLNLPVGYFINGSFGHVSQENEHGYGYPSSAPNVREGEEYRHASPECPALLLAFSVI
jgi:hypothetical protein